MRIKWIEAKPHPGGDVMIAAVVGGRIQDISRSCSEAMEKPCDLIIKPESKKRSLTANGYYWALIDKITTVLRADSHEIHRQMLARYGVSSLDKNGNPILIRMQEDIDPLELQGIYVDAVESYGGYVTYRVLKGSSEMDAAEFSALLDGLISECKDLGIEVLPDDELQRLFKVS